MSTDYDVVDQIIDAARGTAPLPPGAGSLRENRASRRHPLHGLIAIVQRTPDGGKTIPAVVESRNISAGGMCVCSRFMLHVGQEGAVLIRRSSGEEVMLGVKVTHCTYSGEMKHASGLQFVDLPRDFTIDDFRDQQGNMPSLGRTHAA